MSEVNASSGRRRNATSSQTSGNKYLTNRDPVSRGEAIAAARAIVAVNTKILGKSTSPRVIRLAEGR